MTVHNQINKIVQVKEFHCKVDLEIKYYSNQQGKIKGNKTFNNNSCIYLIEFKNYNRIWVTSKEFEFL